MSGRGFTKAVVPATFLTLMSVLAFFSTTTAAVAEYPKMTGFSLPGGSFDLTIDQATGDVVAALGSPPRVQVFVPVDRNRPVSGYTPGPSFAGSIAFPTGVAVDPSDSDVYVADLGGKTIDKFTAAGAPVEVDPPTNETNQFGTGATPTALSEPWGVAVDPSNGNVYVSDLSNNLVDVYESTGVFVKQFSTGPAPEGLAFNSTGSDFYVVADGESKIEEFSAAGAPVLQTAGPNAGISNVVDGNGTAVAVDPTTNDVYVAGGERVESYAPSGEPLSPPMSAAGIGSAFGFPTGIGVAFGIAVDDSTHAVLVDALINGGVFNPTAYVFEPMWLPEVATGAASQQTATSVTLGGEVDPDGVAVKACEFAYGIGGVSEHSEPCSVLPGSGTAFEAVHAGVEHLQPNTTYSYRLLAADEEDLTDGWRQGGSTGTFKTLTVPPVLNEPPPVKPVTGITRTTAFLHATINPEHSPTTYHFLYVEAAKYEPAAKNPYHAGGVTPSTPAGEGVTDAMVASPPLTGLRPGTTYDYALVASNEADEASPEIGQRNEFTTLPPSPPTVGAGQISALTSTTATIIDSIETHGLPTTYELDLGGEEAEGVVRGTRIFGQVALGQETIAVGVEDLQPGTIYHYRVIASNEDGSSAGPPGQTFTTAPGVPSTLAQPATAPLLPVPSIRFPTPVQLEVKKSHCKKKSDCKKKKSKRKKNSRRGRTKGKTSIKS